jgi:hypothetical protein
MASSPGSRNRRTNHRPLTFAWEGAGTMS